jgi:predicted aspartyl protease/Flp pilus assembly protein TadD
MNQLGSLPVVWENNRALVPVHINGQQPYALIDTGASNTILFQSGAEQLGLRIHPISAQGFEGIGGYAALGVAHVTGFSIVGSHTRDEDIGVVGANFPSAMNVVMTLGQDVLTVSDIEFDFGNGQIRFFRPQNCGNALLAYWTPNYSQIRIQRRREGDNLLVEAEVNGHRETVLLDTGAPTSLLSLAAAHDAGVAIDSADAQAAGHVTGIGSQQVAAWLGRFDTFQIGGETIRNARLLIADFGHRQGLNGIDMILGADFFRTHRVLVAYSQAALYFSYNGGRVFQTFGAAEPATSADGASAAEPTTAEGYFNRATASLQHGDIDAGLSDLNHAITLNATFSAAIFRRGQVYDARRDWAHAQQDFDAAVALAPTNPAYLNEKCWSRAVHGNDLDVAKAACDASLRIHANDANVLDSRGLVLLRQQQYAPAWADYDAAVRASPTAAHPLYGRGIAALRLGRTEQGRADIARATALNAHIAEEYAAYGITAEPSSPVNGDHIGR